MEPYWDEGKQTSEIPRELVIQDVEQDVRDTTQIYLQQLKQAEEQGVLTFLEYRMDALLACIEIEINGLYIDREIFQKNKEQIRLTLEEKKARLNQLVSNYWR
jgi:DNA polymerase I-like protein with 3'-5' exonuclease and polymerase domains